MRILCLILLLTLSAAARPGLITQDFQDADLVYVVKTLAHAMNCQVYIGPGVEGQVTVRLHSVPPEAALAMILADQKNKIVYRLVGSNTLIVAAPEKYCNECFLAPEPEPKGPRQEFPLRFSPGAGLIERLETLFPNCKFRMHSTLNNILAYGNRADLESVAREVARLDVEPARMTEPIVEKVAIPYAYLAEVKSLLATLVPDVKVTVVEDGIVLDGARSGVEQAKELIEPPSVASPDLLVLECKLIDASLTEQQHLGVDWITPVTTLPIRYGTLTTNPHNLAFLIAQSEAHVLASPRVALQSGTEGLIHIEDKFPLVRLNREFGQFQTDYEDLGLSLTALCTRLPDQKIRCQLKGKFTLLDELLAERYPLVHRVTFECEVVLEKDQTLVIGGLTSSDSLEAAVRRVPLLAHLPIQGPLYRNQTPGRQLYLMVKTY